MNPHIIKLLTKGYKEKMKSQDTLNWYLGQYFASALDSTVCNAILWRKKGSKPHSYMAKPIIHQLDERNKPMTEDELQRQRELFVAKLEVMKTNFELSHPKKVKGDSAS